MKTAFTFAALTIATPALAHDGMHVHPHGFGAATLVVVASLVAGAFFVWGRK
ncbi:hypothetical protein [Actibacterium lipolyticum]|uniref:hypothetical protein n=1 Tax=Actibacterium lipolyticum TaxID=1524263 RepID=UPI001F29EAFC|nr:hypothetical protein [Actibacterium lipolyticum]